MQAKTSISFLRATQIKTTPPGMANIKMLNNTQSRQDAQPLDSYTWLWEQKMGDHVETSLTVSYKAEHIFTQQFTQEK